MKIYGLVGKVVSVQFGPHPSNTVTGKLTGGPSGIFYVGGYVFTEKQVVHVDGNKVFA